MRVIITGGTGLIGKQLASNLSDQYEVVVLTRSPEKQQNSMPSAIKLVRWDGKSTDGWGELADGAFAIINLAGAGIADKRWTDARKKLIIDSRVNAGHAVVAAVEQATQKPQVVLQASAVGYYGNQRGDEILTEQSAIGQGFTAEVSAPWEASSKAVEAMNVRRVVLRTGIVLSKHGGALPQMSLPFKFFVGGKLGDGKQWMPWIHIADQVAAMRFLLEDSSADGVFNLTAPEPVTNQAMTQKIGTVLKRPAFFSVPRFMLQLLLGEMADIVVEGQRAIPQRLLAQGYQFQYDDVETALRAVLL